MLERAARGWAAAPPLGWELAYGQSPGGRTGAARRPRKHGRGVWGAANRSSFGSRGPAAPRVLTVPNELTKGCLWGGSAPP